MGDKNDMRVGLKDTIKITQSDLKERIESANSPG